jgi:transcription-repair coupling factor (superfamily II helicase)
VPAFIPDPYMPDVHQRLFFYKRFAQAAADEELDEIRAEIIDRCGDAPEELDALCELMQVKVRLRALAIRALETGPGRIVLTLGNEAALDPFKLAKHVAASNGAIRLTPDMKLVARLGPAPAAPPGGIPRTKAAKAAAVRAAVAKAMPAPTSPAAEAASGRELLRQARELLSGLAACARD